jgi:hypothetical protein
MATPLTNSFFQVRLGGAITTTSGGNRVNVGGVIGLNINDSGAFANTNQLFITGATGIAYTNFISGILASQIAGATAGISQINGLSGNITFAGTGNGVGSQINNITVLTGAGGHIYISGSGIAQAFDLFNTGSALYQLLTNASGQFNTNFATVANLAATGTNLYNLITGLSGQANLNSVNFSVIVPTGSGSLSINFPFIFATVPQVDPTFVVSGSNPFSYGVFPNSITTTGYLALFTDIVLESGNSVYTQAHI